eukprot:GHVU01178102.1.p1 GENE.GHVU01178102.1~~GHVU01178102.1.p1  ORF type:complete len:131 (-),score=11.40 GHVU01178102.1:248-640(-)
MDELSLPGMTVALCGFADGGKASPFVVVKTGRSSADPKPASGEPSALGVVVTCNAKGWMTEPAMLKWLDSSWTNRPGAISGSTPSAVLLLDGFVSHTNEKVSSCAGVGLALLEVPALLSFRCLIRRVCAV